MVTRFELRWAARRILGRNPYLYAFVKRVVDRFTGSVQSELDRALKAASDHPHPPSNRGKVLFFSPRWWPTHAAWELVMAYALRAEGYRPEFVICGGAAHSCDMYAAEIKAGALCRYCSTSFESYLSSAGMPFRAVEDFVPLEQIRLEAHSIASTLSLKQCRDFEIDDIPVGRLIEPAVARSLRRVTLTEDGLTISLYRRYLETALINVPAIEQILKDDWHLVFMLNGKFLQESLVYYLARKADLDVVTYERGFRVNTLFFAVNDQVTNFDISHHFRRVQDRPLTSAQEQQLVRYEDTRRAGKEAIVQYFPKIDEDESRIMDTHGISGQKHLAVVYPNIVWDTAVFGHERAFASIWDWMACTIRTYGQLDDWQLIVRIHPAEIRLPVKTRESMASLIAEHFPELPANTHIIPAEAEASSYKLMDLADRVLVYSSTMGLEAAMAGKSVVTAAHTHYSELGFTEDPRSSNEYQEVVRSKPQPVEAETRQLARRYASLFFSRFHVPVKSVDETILSRPQIRFEGLNDLLSGKYPEVEFIRHQLFPLENGCRILPPDSTTVPTEI